MIEFKTGDVLNERAQALVNTVNCVGVMGRGVALQFKEKWPDNFRTYAAACGRGEVQPGRMFVYATGGSDLPHYIINFPTKRHWRGKSRLEDIDAGLRALVDEVRCRHITSIAIPPLGAGLGGLDWRDVRSRIVTAFEPLTEVRTIVYEPGSADQPSHPANARNGKSAPRMTPGRAALIGLMNRYVHGLLDPSVSLLEVHKLLYFMQEAGQPLRLNVVKRYYGPYAENLRHVLREIEGYYISGFGHGGDSPEKLLDLVPGAVEDADAVLREDTETRTRFERVSDLVRGFESSFGLELLATVHWVMSREGARSEEEVIARTYDWGPRKRQFAPQQIGLARRVLIDRGWVTELEG